MGMKIVWVGGGLFAMRRSCEVSPCNIDAMNVKKQRVRSKRQRRQGWFTAADLACIFYRPRLFVYKQWGGVWIVSTLGTGETTR